MTLPINILRLNVPLLKNLSEQLWLQKRNTLKMSPHADINQIWSDTSGKHIPSDSLLITCTYSMAVKTLKAEQIKKATNHVNMLEIQGISARSVLENIPKSNINTWASNLEISSGSLHNFARKALQQQLPTLANLARWKKVFNSSCPLCNKGAPQTNKHVLSNCSSDVALNRYTQRHNAVLYAIAKWIHSIKSADQQLFADVISSNFIPFLLCLMPQRSLA